MADSKTSNNLFPGIGIGLLLGIAISWTFGQLRGEHPSGGQPGTLESGSLTAPDPHTVATASLSDRLAVTLGRGTRETGYIQYPVVVNNQTGQALFYVEASCIFYDKSGEVVSTGLMNWMQVSAGAKVSGHMNVEGADPYRYECRGAAKE